VLLCVAGIRFARSTAQLSCPPLSLPTQILESKPTAHIDNPAVLHLQKYVKHIGRLLLCRCDEIEVKDSTVQGGTIVHVGVQACN
jgi:hypothetical protein